MKTFKIISHEGYSNVNSSESRFLIRADYFDTLGGELYFYKNVATDGEFREQLIAAFSAGQWVAAWEVEDNG